MMARVGLPLFAAAWTLEWMAIAQAASLYAFAVFSGFMRRCCCGRAWMNSQGNRYLLSLRLSTQRIAAICASFKEATLKFGN